MAWQSRGNSLAGNSRKMATVLVRRHCCDDAVRATVLHRIRHFSHSLEAHLNGAAKGIFEFIAIADSSAERAMLGESQQTVGNRGQRQEETTQST